VHADEIAENFPVVGVEADAWEAVTLETAEPWDEPQGPRLGDQLRRT
jgi:hypothetical protein